MGKKINFSIRIKNPAFLYMLGAYVASYIYAYYGITGEELTSWSAVYELGVKVIKNPAILVPLIVGIVGHFVDFTTKGIYDTERVLEYKKPDEDK